jgi:FkbM family methyltransferase
MASAKNESEKSKSHAESRVELKNVLDSISSSKLSIDHLQDLIKNGPKRKIVMDENSITIQMLESGSIYEWYINDPRTAVACLVATGKYETIETKILQHLANGAELVVDIGANVGYYTVELAKSLGSSGQLLGFEPVEQSFSQLRKNVKLNNIENKVRIFQTGLSNSVSETQIFLPRKSGSSAASLRNLHPEEEYESQIINTTTLDNVFETLGASDCDLIKIDVEGGELQVIEGGIATIKRFKPIIFAELLRKWSEAFSYSPNNVLQILQNIGYSCWGVSEELREITVFKDTDVETNFLFIHAEKFAETMESLQKTGVNFRVN